MIISLWLSIKYVNWGYSKRQIIFYEFTNKRQFFTSDPLELDPEFYEVPKKIPDILQSPLVQGTQKHQSQSEMEESLRQVSKIDYWMSVDQLLSWNRILGS